MNVLNNRLQSLQVTRENINKKLENTTLSDREAQYLNEQLIDLNREIDNILRQLQNGWVQYD